MSTFSQWHARFKKTEEVKRVTWVCGAERILVDEVVNTIRSTVDPGAFDHVILNAGLDSERTIWNGIRQHPMGLKGNRLTIVLHANRLGNDDAFEAYVRDRGRFPRNYVIFVSDDNDFPRLPPEPDVRGKGELRPGLAYLQNKGDMIVCRSYTQDTAKHAVKWVQDRAHVTPNIAAHLLNRANGDLRLVRDVCDKLAVFPFPISIATINEMLTQQPQETFVEALFSLDKKTALLALKDLPRTEWSKTLGLIDTRLDLAGLVHDMMVERKSPAEIAIAAGNKNFLVRDITPVAKHYDAKRRQKIRDVLALVDEYAPVYPNGVLESIVAFW